MKTLIAAAALLALTAPAQAQWQGGAAQQAAAAYCSSRAAGNNHAKAERDARWMLTNSLNGGFADMMSTALTSGRQMMQTTGYLARQMCPEYFASATYAPLPVEPVVVTPPPTKPNVSAADRAIQAGKNAAPAN